MCSKLYELAITLINNLAESRSLSTNFGKFLKAHPLKLFSQKGLTLNIKSNI
jgi:hypothetical protein